jgi:hypothetical protein
VCDTITNGVGCCKGLAKFKVGCPPHWALSIMAPGPRGATVTSSSPPLLEGFGGGDVGWSSPSLLEGFGDVG